MLLTDVSNCGVTSKGGLVGLTTVAEGEYRLNDMERKVPARLRKAAVAVGEVVVEGDFVDVSPFVVDLASSRSGGWCSLSPVFPDSDRGRLGFNFRNAPEVFFITVE
jgi:hypothetical protein